MTAPLRNGTETPFSEWLRKHPDIDSKDDFINVTDVDYLFQRYEQEVPDPIRGTRKLQLAMWVELKTHNAPVPFAQRELLYFHDQLLNTMGNSRKIQRISGDRVAVWHFGVKILVLPEEHPGQSRYFKWGQFEEDGTITYKEIRTCSLPFLLNFQIRPDNFKKTRLTQHHAITEMMVREVTPLGFEVDRIIEKRS